MTTSAGIVPYVMPSHNGILASRPGTVARHVITLAALISGIVGSKSTHLPHIAAKVPDGTKPESRVKRFARWCDNAHILEEVYFLPYAEVLLRHLALQTLVLVMDGSGVGRGCTALMIHVVYKGRALPLAWRVRQAPKGHFPEALHIAMVELMREVIPAGAKVVLLGDGEFDGTALQATLQRGGLVLRLPHGHEHDGDVGRHDVSPRYFGGVSQARPTDRAQRRPCHTRGVWSHHGAVLLGQGISRAAVFGQQYGHRRGSLSLV